MVRGLFVAGTGMLTAQKTMDVVTHNITNVETVGYKQDNMISQTFASMLIERIHDPSVIAQREVGPFEPGVHIDRIVTDFTQGGFDVTNSPTDMALAGAGWFVVETPEGERFTRAGNFHVAPNGMLVTPEGYGVLGEGGPIQVGSDQFAVNEDGQITVGDTPIDKLRLVTFQDDGALRKQGDNLYYDHDGAVETQRGCVVKQTMLEMSNVNVSEVMVDMLVTYRHYEVNQRIMQMTDETIGKAVNEVGKIN